jgi:2-hydroxy-3-keto-5-methylthiopentenyl-1-phosphate phosphatase
VIRLVLDWDGTVTERDTLDLVLQEFGDAEIYARV